ASVWPSMRTVPFGPRWRIMSAAFCSVSSAFGRRSALSKSNSTSAARSMRTSVSVSRTVRSSTLPPMSTTLKTRSSVLNTRSTTCARSGAAPRNARSTRARRMASPADRHIVHRLEVRHDHGDLLHVVGRGGEARPEALGLSRLHFLDALAADALIGGIADDEVLFLPALVDELHAADRAVVDDLVVLVAKLVAAADRSVRAVR